MKNLNEAVQELSAGIKRAKRIMKDGRLKKQYTRIVVTEREGKMADVKLAYSGEWYIMFGKCQLVNVKMFNGSLEEACNVARQIKAELKSKHDITMPIQFVEYEEFDMF